MVELVGVSQFFMIAMMVFVGIFWLWFFLGPLITNEFHSDDELDELVIKKRKNDSQV